MTELFTINVFVMSSIIGIWQSPKYVSTVYNEIHVYQQYKEINEILTSLRNT